MHTYNNKKNNIVLGYLRKILGFSQSLQDIIQIYVKIILDFYPDFYNYYCFAIYY